MLNTYVYKNKPRVPLLVDAEGRKDPYIIMVHGEETEVYVSCSVTYRNKFYVYGGSDQKRQISEVKQCELKRIGTLDFDHKYGSCSNVDDQEIYLCFGDNESKQCRSAIDPLESFTKIASSTFEHNRIRTAASSSKFLMYCVSLLNMII